MQLLAHPFRLVAGKLATVRADSDDAITQLLTVLVTTRRGERQLVPAFGITDPTFAGIDVAEINAGLAMFGPQVTVVASASHQVDGQTDALTLSWQDNASA